jgi:KDO2-lipid IV(A) lauroyltransferase
MSAPRLPAVVRAAMWLDYFVLMPATARVSWRLALWWGRRRGTLLFWWRTVGRRAAVDNVLRAHRGTLAPAAARAVALGSFRAQTCEEVETFFFPALTGPRLERFVRVEGREHLDRALARDRGAVVFSAHYGSFCLAMLALAHLGYKVNVLARSLAEEANPLQPAVRRYAGRKVAHLERALGRPFIVIGEPGTMLKVRRALREREIVYALLDVPPELVRRRERVRFLGHPAEIPFGAEFIAAATGAPLVPFVVRRNRDRCSHTLHLGAEVPGPEHGPGALQRCVDEIEREIRADPSQFFMWEYARSFWIDDTDASAAVAAPANDAARGTPPAGGAERAQARGLGG